MVRKKKKIRRNKKKPRKAKLKKIKRIKSKKKRSQIYKTRKKIITNAEKELVIKTTKDWIKNFKLRLFHFGLMFLVTFETLVGITCPLTSIENYLRGINNSKSFISFWIEKIIYWDFPTSFFIFLYFVFFGWTLIMWKIYPPKFKDSYLK